MLHYDEYGRELLEICVGNRVGGRMSRGERRGETQSEMEDCLQALGLIRRKHAVQGKIRREQRGKTFSSSWINDRLEFEVATTYIKHNPDFDNESNEAME